MLGLTILCQSVFGMNVAIDSTQDSGQNQTSALCLDVKASQEDDRAVQYQISLLYLDMKTLRKDGRIVLYYLDKNGGTPTGEPIILDGIGCIGMMF